MGKYIPLLANDYYNVFTKFLDVLRDAKLHNIMINFGFVISLAAKDKDVIDNFKYRKWYSECVDLLVYLERQPGETGDSALADFIIGEDSQLHILFSDFIVKPLPEKLYKIRIWFSTK